MTRSAGTRRDFLKDSIAAAGTVGGVMALSGLTGGARAEPAAASVMRVPGANERINIGIIGAGGRGSELMGQINGLAQGKNVQISAVCDVWKVNLEAAANKVKSWFGAEPYKCTRFGEVLARDDIHAVVIATPDFAHCPIMIEALKSGKDVYCEKPMATEIEDANTALDLARKLDRVVQVGTQRRSEGVNKAAAKVVASGVLGRISRISAANNFNHPRWVRAYDDCKKEDVDWDAFLFNRPKVPFDPRMLREWQLFKTFTNGLAGLWMSHLVDLAHMIMGASYPTSAVALGGTYVWKDDRQHTDTFHALLDYPEGFLFSWGMGLGNSAGTHYTIHGRRGTLDLEASTVSGAGGDPQDSIKESIKLQGEPDESHMGNWIDCMRSRKRPNADIQYGHQHAVATIMAATALETGQRQKYERAARRVHSG